MRSPKIKILHILWSGEIGGTEEYILTFVRNLDCSRYDIHLCFLSRKGQIYEEAGRLDNIQVKFIGIKNGYDVKGAILFALYLYRSTFDLIHSHMRNYLSTAVMILCAGRVPKILTHHVGPVDRRLVSKEKRFYKLFSKFFRNIIAISGLVKEYLMKDLGVKSAENILVIQNGIDLNKYNKAAAVPPDLKDIRRSERYIVGFIGRMEYFKRPQLFIEIAFELIQQDGNFNFVMVGDGRELAICKKLIHQYGIESYFTLTGFRRDIPEILNLLDAMMFTAAGEGFGIVIIEAMSRRIPVFAINDGAVSEIIRHEQNGILFNTTDPKNCARQMVAAMRNRKLMEKIKKQCAEDVRSNFSIKECVRKMEIVYQSVL